MKQYLNQKIIFVYLTMNTSGIYKIVNILTKKFYIGSAKNIKRRWSYHKSSLIKNLHSNNHLQKAWNKYGEENFEFEIIEECSSEKDILLSREQFYIDTLKPEYNILRIAGSNQGRIYGEETRIKQRSKRYTKESKLLISESLKLQHKEGKREWVYKKISQSKLGRTKENDKGRLITSIKMKGNKNSVNRKITAKGTIWIHNKIISKMINPSEKDSYINNGWYLGRIINKKKKQCRNI